MKLFTCLLLSSVFALSVFAKYHSKTDTLSAATIVHKSESAYAAFKTYLDSGKLVTTMYTEHPNKTAKIFKTAYSNTGQFNFEYYTVGNSTSLYTINRSDSVVKTWWGVTNATKTITTLHLALASAAGVSSRLSLMIPNLLSQKDFGTTRNILETFIPELSGVEEVSGIPCYKIGGTDNFKMKITVWIAKKDFLIRKIETESKVDPAKTEAMVSKMEAMVRAQHSKKDTAFFKQDSIRHKRNAALLALQSSIKPFMVTNTYVFYPYTAKKVNPELFKFRPNREVAL